MECVYLYILSTVVLSFLELKKGQNRNLFLLVYIFGFRSNERQVPEFIDPRFRENKPKTLVFSH
jgi:hypothetical protein